MNTPTEQTGPTVDDVLTQRVYIPHFVEKCGEAGIAINTQDDLRAALEIANTVRMQKEASGVPQGIPQPGNSLLKEAAAGLAQAISSSPDASHYLQDPMVSQALAVAAQ